jgi:hypothetical protein
LADKIAQGVARKDLGRRVSDLSVAGALFASPFGVVDDPGAAELAVLPAALCLPDLRLLPQDALSSGSGFAMRGGLQGHHTAAGWLGPATGRRLGIQVMMAARTLQDDLAASFVIADLAAVVAASGQSLRDWAKAHPLPPPPDLSELQLGRSCPADDWGTGLAAVLRDLVEDPNAAAARHYAPACCIAGPGGYCGFGREDVAGLWAPLMGALPGGRLTVHQSIGAVDPLMPPRAHLCWSWRARHDGWGGFGPPTGAPVTVHGITQAEFGPEGLSREMTLFDPLSIWAQIHRFTAENA